MKEILYLKHRASDQRKISHRTIFFLRNRSVADMQGWKMLIDNMIQISVSCSKFSVSIVSHSSPEGYLPDEAYGEK